MTFTRHLGKISENRPHRPHPRLIGAFQPIFPMDQCAENFLNQLLGSMGPSSAHGLQKAPVCFWRMTCVIYGFRGKKSEFISHMLHGAGIFTYKTGWFLGQMLVNIPYMEHMGMGMVWDNYTRSWFCRWNGDIHIHYTQKSTESWLVALFWGPMVWFASRSCWVAS